MEKPSDLRIQPSEKAWFLSKLFFCWAPKFFYEGYVKHLNEEYYAPIENHKSRHLGEKLQNAWKNECCRNENPFLRRALWKTFYLEFTALGFLFIISEFTFKISQPWLIGKLMDGVTNMTNTSKREYYFNGFLVILFNFLSVVVSHFYQLKVLCLGMKIRIACCSLIYRKALKISKKSEHGSKMGTIINLLSNDVNRFDLAPMHLIQLLVSPVETVFVIYGLYAAGGSTTAAGIVFLFLFMPLQMLTGKLTTALRRKTATKTDRRIKLMNEIITGIKVIKMFAWEKLFTQMIEKLRRVEIDQITKMSYVRALNVSFMLFINRTGIFLSVMTYYFVQKEIDAKYVFVVSSFYALLRQTLTVYLPFGIQNFSETRVSVQRIQLFLSSDEKQDIRKKSVTYVATNTQKQQLMKTTYSTFEKTDIEEKKIGVNLKNVSVKWVKSAPRHTLNSVHFEARSKELVIVTGPVGGGKSSLLYTILKELPLLEGELNVVGTVSYAPQEPWLFSGTVQENIIFESKFDRNKYQEIIKVCQLENDFSIFPYGDKTLVGENGALLSGGQKARIGLARSLYKDADIYLLDDLFASVDTKVGNKIFQDSILGYLKDKCVILVTHSINYFSAADKMYKMDEGILINNIEIIKEKSVFTSEHIEDYLPVDSTKNPKRPQEKTQKGTVSRKVYKKYVLSGGHYLTHFCLLFLFLASQFAASGADYFVAFWVNIKQNESNSLYIDNNTCVIIYAALITATITLPVVRSTTFFKCCMRASVKLHNNMFSAVITAPLTFFEINQSGGILNRFSKDIGTIDETIPSILMDTLQITFIVLGSVFLIIFLDPWMLVPTAVICSVFYFFKTWFLSRSRNIKRLEASARTPIYTHVRETLQGLTVIRTYNVQDPLKQQFDCYQDLHSSAFYTFLTCNRAFGFWMDLICVLYTIGVIVSIMLIDTQAGNIGLSITQSMNLIGVLQWGIKQWSELENQMINIERVIEYTQIMPEKNCSEKVLPKIWPQNGRIEFQSVSLYYPQNERLILNNITLTVESKEKIGIVGRTGAGKSSLISALFRLYNFEGNIFIDDVNISEIPLDILRSKISIIPQEPVLFTGTLRENLDPFYEFDDSTLWKVLEQVKLKNSVSNLFAQVLEDGSNFSVGQKQLICLARAILRNNKIVVLDEATANIDLQTEQYIQEAVQKEFQNFTVLTVAHRLDTIMNSDKIMLIDDGRVIEFDTPHNLLRNPEHLFSQIVKECREGLNKCVQA